VGTKLDGYEILGLIGAGGMGEICRAGDVTLKREVAIKVLALLPSTNSARSTAHPADRSRPCNLNTYFPFFYCFFACRFLPVKTPT